MSMLTSVDMTHRDGVPWWSARLPHRWHRCSVQTEGWLGMTQIDRCACGAIRRNGRTWLRRNDRRKK